MKKVQIKMLVDVAGMAAGDIKNARTEVAAVMVARGQAEYVDSEGRDNPAGKKPVAKKASKGVAK